MDGQHEREPVELDPAGELDPGADTGRFRAFAAGGGTEGVPGPVQRGGSSASFRLLTLLGGLVVFVGIVWLLLR